MWESSINRPLQVEHRDMAWLTFGRISCGLHESLVWISIQIMKTAVWRTKKFQFFLHFEDLFLRFVVFTKSKHRNRSEGCWYPIGIYAGNFPYSRLGLRSTAITEIIIKIECNWNSNVSQFKCIAFTSNYLQMHRSGCSFLLGLCL